MRMFVLKTTSIGRGISQTSAGDFVESVPFLCLVYHCLEFFGRFQILSCLPKEEVVLHFPVFLKIFPLVYWILGSRLLVEVYKHTAEKKIFRGPEHNSIFLK
jgi:hypothetical protein